MGSRGCVVSPHRGFSVSHHCVKRSVRWRDELNKRTDHDTLRYVRLGEKYNSCFTEDLHDQGILFGGLERSPTVPQCRIVAFDVELIFQRHGDTVKRPNSLLSPGDGPVKSLGMAYSVFEQNLGQAAGRVRCRASLCCRRGSIPVRLCQTARSVNCALMKTGPVSSCTFF